MRRPSRSARPEPPPPNGLSGLAGAVQARGLVVAHGDFSMKIEDFTLEAGARLALCGPSGCGKTTFLETLALLRTPAAGALSVLGHRPRARSRGEARRLRGQRIGLALADLALLPHLTVEQNVALPLSLGRRSGHSPATTLRTLGLAALASRLPADLSQGERQRTSLARALVGAPDLVLADEPTAHLDAQTAAATLDGLLALLEPNATLVLVSHDPAQLARCSEVWRWGR